MNRRTPSEALRAAVVSIDDIADVLLTRSLAWDPQENCWTICLRISINQPSLQVPPNTDWFVLVDDTYPRGRLEIYPSNSSGLAETFPHQLLNLSNPAREWRTGRICVDAPGFLSRWVTTGEPSSNGRLAWHIERARDWLVRASQGKLRSDGDQFELPVIPPGASTPMIVFEDGPEHLSTWMSSPARFGYVEFREVPGGTVAATRWWSSSSLVRATTWGTRISEGHRSKQGHWILLDAMPAVEPFRWPLTWGELVARSGQNFLEILRAIIASTGRRTSVLMLGFPIPEKVGGDPHEVYWTALQIGPLRSTRKRRPEPAVWERDRTEIFADDAPVRWLPAENWHPSRLGARGRLVEKLRALSVVVVGVGALGSSVAELLVRGGVIDLTVIDGDTVIAGNLVRHTLTISDHRSSKARSVAERLNAISPFAKVASLVSMLSLNEAVAKNTLDPFDMIIDCTANDDIVRMLGRVDFGRHKLIASAAVGRASRRLYFFEAEGAIFPAEHFWRKADPWFADERIDDPNGTPFEGPGCWHPIFPAQGTDLSMMASIAVKRLERLAERGGDSDGKLLIFEQAEDGDGFTRVQRVDRKG